jgi:inhibitor of cysteine peptidase
MSLNRSPDVVSGAGTVRYHSLEGGFYGIVGDDGRHLDPTNLPDSLKTDGLRVRYVARPRQEGISVHMWGTIVELISIEPEP